MVPKSVLRMGSYFSRQCFFDKKEQKACLLSKNEIYPEGSEKSIEKLK